MRSTKFRDEQWRHRFDPYVAPVNELVDRLIEERGGSWMPYIPAYHGGIESEILLLYQDPGKMTAKDFGGSGFLGSENDDPTAQVLAECLDAADLDAKRVTPWNAYPWFLSDQGRLTDRMIKEGLNPLHRLLELIPTAHTIVTGGAKAHHSWRLFSEQYRDASRWRHIKTFHTSGRGITNGGRQTKVEGIAHVVAAFREAATPPDAP
ncbi:MAG: hypothetical protein JJLCMIEE_03084 [Acidimicrobiales bacterium]|nr:hypothetical protein [Acidimicrobiales bacterium]